jgi:hypothetical protein
MPSALSRRRRVAKFPRVTMTFGSMRAICSSR